MSIEKIMSLHIVTVNSIKKSGGETEIENCTLKKISRTN